jgi:superfamily I DNA/RNA helicase
MIASASPAAVRGSLDPPDATSGRVGVGLKGEDYTILSTIHSAKGQEWRIVRVLNVVDGCILSDRDHQHAGGDRGRASASLRGNDPSEDRAGPNRAAAGLHASADQAR